MILSKHVYKSFSNATTWNTNVKQFKPIFNKRENTCIDKFWRFSSTHQLWDSDNHRSGRRVGRIEEQKFIFINFGMSHPV